MNANPPIIPFYFLIDTCESEGHALVEFANSFLNMVFLEVVADPLVDQLVRMAVLDMGQTPTVALPLSRPSDLLGLPGLVPTGSLSLGGSLETLKKIISDDVDRLKEQGFRVYRPVVMMFLAHESGDEWRSAHREISDRVSFRYAPNIFCFGTGAANVSDVREIASTSNGQVDASVANILDLGIGSDPLARSIVQHFFVDVLREIRQARVASGPEYRIPLMIPGVTPADEATEPPSDPVILGDNNARLDATSVVERHWTPRLHVWPLYIVCDEGSLEEVEVEAVNQEIAELIKMIYSDPVVDSMVRIGLIAFDDKARVLVPLTQLSAVTHLPGLVSSGRGSSYAAVFRLLRAQIESDASQLTSDRFRIRRPIVFFISRGSPSPEDWHTPLSALTDQSFKVRPIIASFGVMGADASVIKEVSTPLTVGASKKQSFAFLAEAGVTAAEVFREINLFLLTGPIGSDEFDALRFSLPTELPNQMTIDSV